MQWQILRSTGFLPSSWKENIKTKVCVWNLPPEMLGMDDGVLTVSIINHLSSFDLDLSDPVNGGGQIYPSSGFT